LFCSNPGIAVNCDDHTPPHLMFALPGTIKRHGPRLLARAVISAMLERGGATCCNRVGAVV